jgi:predicted metal-binding membrane protein
MRAARHQSAFVPLMALLTATAWLTLWLWAGSPYGRYLDHGSWLEAGFAGSICRALPAGELLLPGVLYIGGWLLMTAAMMLPTALPLLEIFRRMTAARTDRTRLLALAIGGYLGIWGGFGAIAHLADQGVHALASTSSWLTFNGWLLGAAALALAGLFQFSALKYRCLEQCRTPMSFIARHWRGENASWEAFALGAHHGLYCVGCCWALMLLMFVVGMGSVGWMLLLGAIMAAEKNLPWGGRLSAPLGLALLLWASWIAVGSGAVAGWLPLAAT